VSKFEVYTKRSDSEVECHWNNNVKNRFSRISSSKVDRFTSMQDQVMHFISGNTSVFR